MMQDLPSAPNGGSISGQMDSTANSTANTNANTNPQINTNQENESESQGALATVRRYLPIVKYVGSKTTTFFTSGQFKRTIRPSAQFIDPRCLALPQSVGQALARYGKNFGFYKSNYAIITFVCCGLWFWQNPTSIIVLGVLGLIWFYVIKTSNKTIKIGETEYGPMQKYMVAILITLVAMLLFGIIGTIMGGVSLGIGVSSVHAVCHVKPDSGDAAERQQLRDLNDIESETDPILHAATNVNLDALNENGDGITTFNGLEIMQIDDNESFSVNEVNMNNNNNNGNNDGNINNNANANNSIPEQTSIFEKMENPNQEGDDDQPELGLPQY